MNENFNDIVIEDPQLYDNYDPELQKRIIEKLKKIDVKPEFTKNAIRVLSGRYFIKNSAGEAVEDVIGLFSRVAANVALADFFYGASEEETFQTAKDFYEMMINREFMPNSPTIMNAGRINVDEYNRDRRIQQLSACFVLPVEDNMESIFKAVYDTAMIHKTGGGTGFDFSRLRRKNAVVTTTYGRASGPVSFMIAFDGATSSVNQGGFRRGANMGSLRVDHPDILEFIYAKQKEGAYSNFNFSVSITDEFMKALENNEYYPLRANYIKNKFLDMADIKSEENCVKIGLIKEEEKNLIVKGPKVINPKTKQEIGKVENDTIRLYAPAVFGEIAKLAWTNGEPGVFFIDRINEFNPTPQLGRIEGTNPCGEQPLLPYEACNLGSVNLANMVKIIGDRAEIDYEKFRKSIHKSVHFLDNVIDMSKFPLAEITKMVHTTRKIGFGIMGFADMLIKLKIPYNSEKAVETAEEIMKFLNEESKKKSAEMAEKRGVFPAFKGSIYDKAGRKLRNATTTTIAPTGTISVIAGCSSGIEPLFGLAYEHITAGRFENQELKKDLVKLGINPNIIFNELITGRSLQDLELPEKIKKIYVTTNDIATDWHVKIQAAFQEFTDNGASKTINMPHSATVEDVIKAYKLAYKLGCKGITVYRIGSREVEVITKKEQREEEKEIRKAPLIGIGARIKKRTGCGNIYTHMFIDPKDGKPVEAFGTLGKAGGCSSAGTQVAGRLASLALKHGAGLSEVADEMIGTKCERPHNLSFKGTITESTVLSCFDAMGKSLLEMEKKNLNNLCLGEEREEIAIQAKNPGGLKNPGNPENPGNPKAVLVGSCDLCGSPLIYEGGCMAGRCLNPNCVRSESC